MTVTLPGGGLAESWGRYLSGWRLVSPARDRGREENGQGGREGEGSSPRHVTHQPWLGTWKMWTLGTWDRFQGEEQTGFKHCRQV